MNQINRNFVNAIGGKSISICAYMSKNGQTYKTPTFASVEVLRMYIEEEIQLNRATFEYAIEIKNGKEEVLERWLFV